MDHYICEVCGGASDLPGICSTEGCDKHGEELEICHCEGGVDAHNDAAAEAAALAEEGDDFESGL